MLSSLRPLTTEVVVLVKVEGTLEELAQLFAQGAKEEAKRTAKAAGKKTVKTAVKKAKRAPSAYNRYMKKKLAELKKKHPRMTHQARFKKAAASWKGSKKKGGKR